RKLWRVISDHGHTEAGVITFSVGTGAPPGAAALTASAGVGARAVVSRWLFFAGLLVAAGGAVFRFAVGPARVRVLLPSPGLGLLALLGWLNRYRLIPRADAAGLRRGMRTELVLLAGLVLAVAVLTDLRPGRDRNVALAAAPPARGAPPPPAGDAVVLAQEGG